MADFLKHSGVVIKMETEDKNDSEVQGVIDQKPAICSRPGNVQKV